MNFLAFTHTHIPYSFKLSYNADSSITYHILSSQEFPLIPYLLDTKIYGIRDHTVYEYITVPNVRQPATYFFFGRTSVPQGSILGPTLWDIMYDDLRPLGPRRLGFVDDVATVVVGRLVEVMISANQGSGPGTAVLGTAPYRSMRHLESTNRRPSCLTSMRYGRKQWRPRQTRRRSALRVFCTVCLPSNSCRKNDLGYTGKEREGGRPLPPAPAMPTAKS